MTMSPDHPYALADWRLRISTLYAEVRGMAPEAGWRHWHATRSALFRDHPMSPLPEGDRKGEIPVQAYDPDLRFSVELRPVDGSAVKVDLGTDGQLAYRPVAETIGLAQPLGRELTLFWIGGYGGGLFLPFRDATNGDSTYGGGRYLVDAIKGADLGLDPDGRLILDFNFAYHPSCALNPAYTCPLSPPENSLDVPIPAGERL
ncbi:DUF1684 domain-containing protein [Pontivivens ytuae]|uniref:DUF1684 domain-containing protein n=1 Tax=Pontivivens ytuae TaxID=2789856 RepID=A0A7S9QEW3_9RHOB|nr:DUF1684 domain-containing protein [Pontivivens ytuae]QPH55867.1 DUF1684 domain-containing protein [Pontivivens ytuae]